MKYESHNFSRRAFLSSGALAAAAWPASDAGASPAEALSAGDREALDQWSRLQLLRAEAEGVESNVEAALARLPAWIRVLPTRESAREALEHELGGDLRINGREAWWRYDRNEAALEARFNAADAEKQRAGLFDLDQQYDVAVGRAVALEGEIARSGCRALHALAAALLIRAAWAIADAAARPEDTSDTNDSPALFLAALSAIRPRLVDPIAAAADLLLTAHWPPPAVIAA